MEDDVVMLLQLFIWRANTEATRHTEMNDDVLVQRDRDENIFSPARHTVIFSEGDIF